MRRLRTDEFIDTEKIIRRSSYYNRSSYKSSFGGIFILFLVYVLLCFIFHWTHFKYESMFGVLGGLFFLARWIHGPGVMRRGARKAIQYFIVENPMVSGKK